MKKNTRRLAWILVLCACMALLPACQTTDKGTETAQPTVANTATSLPGVTPEATPPHASSISLMVKEHASFPWKDSLLTLQELQKRIGITLDIQGVPSDSYTEKLNITLASKVIPDLIQIDNLTANTYGMEGAFMALDDFLETKCPYYNQYITYPATLYYLKADDDNLYWMGPVKKYDNTVTIPTYGRIDAFIYRKDILDKLNLAEPETLEGWLDVFRAVKAAYPDMIPYTTRSGMKALFNNWEGAFGLNTQDNSWPYTLYVNDADEWVYTPLTDTAKDMVRFFRTMYEEKLLDQEYVTSTSTDEWVAKMAGGIGFATIDNASRANSITSTVDDEDYKLAIAAPIVTPQGTRLIRGGSPGGVGGDGFAIRAGIGEEALNAIAIYWNYISSDEGALLLRGGFEGQDWELVDGKYQYTETVMDQAAPVDYLRSRGIDFTYMVIPLSTDAIADLIIQVECDFEGKTDAWSEYNRDYASKYTTHCKPQPKMTTENQTRADELKTALDNKFAEYFDKFVLGQLDIDADWDTMVNELKVLGVEELQQIWTAAYQDYLSQTE